MSTDGIQNTKQCNILFVYPERSGLGNIGKHWLTTLSKWGLTKCSAPSLVPSVTRESEFQMTPYYLWALVRSIALYRKLGAIWNGYSPANTYSPTSVWSKESRKGLSEPTKSFWGRRAAGFTSAGGDWEGFCDDENKIAFCENKKKMLSNPPAGSKSIWEPCWVLSCWMLSIW